MGSKKRTDRRPRNTAAAAARQQAARAQHRTRILQIGGAVAVTVTVIAIIAIAVVAGRGSGGTPSAVDPNAAIPSSALGADSTWAWGAEFGNRNATTVEIWEDPQCPACRALEASAGETLHSAIDAGDIHLVIRPTAFLDAGKGGNASARGLAAFGCALDAGIGWDYHTELFTNPIQSAWTDDVLVNWGRQMLEGEDTKAETFTRCVREGRYLPWVANSTAAFATSGYQQTPTVLIDGNVVDTRTLVNPDAFAEAIAR